MEGSPLNIRESEICHIVQGFAAYKEGLKDHVEGTSQLMNKTNKTFGIILITDQRDAIYSSQFIILQVHSTCFGCEQHPSSGVHKSVTTAWPS